MLSVFNKKTQPKIPTFAVIGTGYIFRTHLLAINNIGGKIIDVVSESHGKEAWKKMVENTKADYIVILTPNDLHFKMIRFSVEKGKTVLCEKPLTIKLEEAKSLVGNENIFTVCQLRYHPFVKRIKQEQLSKKIKHQIKMNIFFKRDDKNYIQGWKNQIKRSGGILFNVGIHYFDLLLYLFGEAKRIEVRKIYERNSEYPKAEARGIIEGENYVCEWQMYVNKKEGGRIIKKREFIINNTSYNFSSKDNLAEENLHKFVYQDLLNRKGIKPKDVVRTIELVEKIYKKTKN